MPWQAGHEIGKGKYTIEKVLGQGRSAITYLAYDKNGNRLVIKTPSDELLRNAGAQQIEKFQERFSQEATKLARCQHPNVVRVMGVEFKETYEGHTIVCIPLEYIAGVDLASLPNKKLSETEALEYIRQVGEALIAVHQQGLLHLDIKPQNIMVRFAKREPVLIDFGLARATDDIITSRYTTQSFAPIELYHASMQPDERTDIYSLAATLYVLLTGQIPVDAWERQSKNQRLIPPKELNPKISESVNDAILKGMGLEPQDRPKTVQNWLELLGLKRRLIPIPMFYQDPVLFWTIIAAIAGWLGTMGTWMALMVTLRAPAPSPPPSPVPEATEVPQKSP